MSLAINTLAIRNAGMPAGSEQVRLSLLGAMIGGVPGLLVSKKLAEQSAASAQAPGPGGGPLTAPLTPTGAVMVPPPSPVTLPAPVATAAHVPDVTGQQLDAATRQLYGLGFVPWAITVYDVRESGTVIEQDVRDKTMPKGSRVTLTVSLGPAPAPHDETAEEVREIELMEEISNQLKSAESRDVKVIDALTTLTQAVHDLKSSLGGPGPSITKK